jgi:hypothetical protein
MKTTLLILALMVTVAGMVGCACSSCPPTNPDCNAPLGGGDGSGGSGGAGGGTAARYTIVSLDKRALSDSTYLDMVVDATQNRVGVAYFTGTNYNPDGSIDTPFYHLNYVEWKDGVVSPIEDVVPAITDGGIRRFIGVSIAFDPMTDEPAIAYLGGGSDGSLYWFNSDAVVSLRNAGTWTPESVATMSVQGIMCGTAAEPNLVSDNPAGFVVGLWSAIKYDSTGTMHYCYRDVHTGQFPMQDWQGSDVKCRHGDPHNPSAMVGECTEAGGNSKGMQGSWGGHIQMLMVNDEPMITYDQEPGGADTIGNNVFFQQRFSTGWEGDNHPVMTIANTGDGASMAFDPMVGLGVAVQDQNGGVLYYTGKTLAGTQWSDPDPVFGAGTGGLFPSLAFDPTYHEPAIAYVVCSAGSGVADYNTCPPEDAELRIAQLTSGNWNTDTVEPVVARRLRMGFLPSGKRVLAYRIFKTGEVKLAIEN